MVAQQLQAAKRLRKELQNLKQVTDDDICLSCQDHLLRWKAWIRGPDDTRLEACSSYPLYAVVTIRSRHHYGVHDQGMWYVHMRQRPLSRRYRRIKLPYRRSCSFFGERTVVYKEMCYIVSLKYTRILRS
jgi:hypothetical protein